MYIIIVAYQLGSLAVCRSSAVYQFGNICLVCNGHLIKPVGMVYYIALGIDEEGVTVIGIAVAEDSYELVHIEVDTENA